MIRDPRCGWFSRNAKPNTMRKLYNHNMSENNNDDNNNNNNNTILEIYFQVDCASPSRWTGSCLSTLNRN